MIKARSHPREKPMPYSQALLVGPHVKHRIMNKQHKLQRTNQICCLKITGVRYSPLVRYSDALVFSSVTQKMF